MTCCGGGRESGEGFGGSQRVLYSVLRTSTFTLSKIGNHLENFKDTDDTI